MSYVCECVCVCMRVKVCGGGGVRLPTPSTRIGCDARSIFKRSLTNANSEFFFS